MIQYGAKALPEGGWHTIPRVYAKGALIIGDAASFLNPMRLKGIHTAMKTGMLAAETAFDHLFGGHAGHADAHHGTSQEHHDDDDHAHSHGAPVLDPLDSPLALYWTRICGSWVADELRLTRNFHSGFRHGTIAGIVNSGVILATGGEGMFGRGPRRAGHEEMETIAHYVEVNNLSDDARVFHRPKYDGTRTFDKLTGVFHSGTKHEENQPVHLHVDTQHCATRCATEYGNPCTRFCPAQVYNIVDDKAAPAGKRLQIDFSNCVHCKTCDIMDPYQVITWVTPEGGDGPRYDRL